MSGRYSGRYLAWPIYAFKDMGLEPYQFEPLADGSSGPSSIVRETLTPLPRWTYDRKRQMILKMTEIVRIWQNIGIALNESNPLPPLTLLTSPIFFTHRKLKPKQRSYYVNKATIITLSRFCQMEQIICVTIVCLWELLIVHEWMRSRLHNDADLLTSLEGGTGKQLPQWAVKSQRTVFWTECGFRFISREICVRFWCGKKHFLLWNVLYANNGCWNPSELSL